MAKPGYVGIKPIITQICWRPTLFEESAFQTFKAVTADGRVLSWMPEKAHDLDTIYQSEDNYYHTIDQSHDHGSKYVVAGKLPVLEIFDDETNKRIQFYEPSDHIGHINKIFCAKFSTDNPNIIYSGGWDRNVIMWDIRAGG